MKRADEGLAFLLKYENVAWYDSGIVKILDRRIYPIKTEYVECKTYEEVAGAIKDMVTQSGGPYTAAAMGMVLAAYQAINSNEKDVEKYLEKAAYVLSHARPTTVARMEGVVNASLEVAHRLLKEGTTGNDLIRALFEHAINRCNDNYSRYDLVASNLADKIPQNGTIMTQCFAETIIGTLLRECRRRGNEVKLFCAETRPYFQGARLTASVACDMGFDVTVISDNMPGYTMRSKKIDLFTSAADVITMDGYIINKVGTFQIATMADVFGIPYYVTGTPNKAHPTLDSVKIEERNEELVLEAMGTKLTMPGVKGYYPAFDITPPKLCDGVVTDRGIFPALNLQAYYETEANSKDDCQIC